jgi:hypothetical protein
MLDQINFNLSLPVEIISLVLFALVMLMVIFYSGMAIYSLLHFGRSRIIGAVVSVVYTGLVALLFLHALIVIITF